MCCKDNTYGNDGVLLFADCALNQNPNPEELAAIATASAASFEQFVGGEARVAMLSHSTKGSAKHADVTKVVEATRIAKEKHPEIKLDGELQLDAAIVKEVGELKAPTSTVAGKANVLIFPDIDAGNIGYKLVQRFAGAKAFGPRSSGTCRSRKRPFKRMQRRGYSSLRCSYGFPGNDSLIVNKKEKLKKK